MNKKYLLFFAFLIILVFSIPVVKYEVIGFFNFLKKNIFEFYNYEKENISNLINQAVKIKQLQQENFLLKNKILNFESFYQNCKDLKKFKFVKDSHLVFTKTISYASLPDFSQIYIDYVSKDSFFPKGLVYNNLAAGVVVKSFNNYSLALLNSNKKTSYTVFIGKNKIPGIFYGKVNLIKYIPKFKNVKKGDLVITSGLDGIFYKGAMVGIITKVFQRKLYQEAKIKLFYNDLAPNYFYVVEKYDRIRKKGGDNGYSKH